MVFSVSIVEDDKATQEKLICAIQQCEELLLSSIADSVKTGEAIISTAPDIALIDLGLPDGSGIDLIRTIKYGAPEIDILVISAFGDEQHVIRSIEAGADGYILKTDPYDEICNHILNIKRNIAPISPAIARHILRKCQKVTTTSKQNDDEKLTRREEELLTMLAKGYSCAETGDLLNIRQHTVSTHVKNIYRKLNVHSRTEAIFEAYQMGLIRLND